MTNKLLFSVAIILTLVACNDNKAKPDNEFDVSVSDPKLKSIKPKVLFDEAHKNHHQIETTYKPFATLIPPPVAILSIA